MNNKVNKLDPGRAKPIDVTKTGAIRLVKIQNATASNADIKINGNESIEELLEKSKQLKNQPEEMTEEKIDELREIVRVKRVKQDNPKVVIFLLIILLIIIVFFFIFELPWLINMLHK
jgi:hypothetical protein